MLVPHFEHTAVTAVVGAGVASVVAAGVVAAGVVAAGAVAAGVVAGEVITVVAGASFAPSYYTW